MTGVFEGEIWLVRHGQSGANEAGEIVGRRDPLLTETGRRQAQAVARRVRSAVGGTAHVVSSPLARALETARPIADALATGVAIEEDLIEMDYGDLEGLRFVELLPDWPPTWVRDPDCPPPGGESYSSVEARVTAALDRGMRAASIGGAATLVVVTHLGPIKAIVKAVLDGGSGLYEHLAVSHGSTSTVRVQRGRRVVASLNVAVPMG